MLMDLQQLQLVLQIMAEHQMNLGDLIWEAIFPLINPPLVMGILFFGQDRLAHFLHHERDSMSLKLMSRCIHEDLLPSFHGRCGDVSGQAEVPVMCYGQSQ